MALQFKRLQQDADLRYALVRVREAAESIAFFRGAAAEALCADARFRAAIATARAAAGWIAAVDLWKNAYAYATIVVPSVVTAPRYFAGDIQFGVISQVRHEIDSRCAK